MRVKPSSGGQSIAWIHRILNRHVIPNVLGVLHYVDMSFLPRFQRRKSQAAHVMIPNSGRKCPRQPRNDSCGWCKSTTRCNNWTTKTCGYQKIAQSLINCPLTSPWKLKGCLMEASRDLKRIWLPEETSRSMGRTLIKTYAPVVSFTAVWVFFVHHNGSKYVQSTTWCEKLLSERYLGGGYMGVLSAWNSWSTT